MTHSDAGASLTRKGSRFGSALARVGGADRAASALADESFGVHATLGLAIIATAFVSAAGGTYFLAIATHSRPASLWWALLVWAGVIGNLDRALVMAGTNRRTVLITLPLRAVIALLIGYWSASAVLQIVYAPEIAAQVASDTQRAYAANLQALHSSYQAKIDAAQRDAAGQQRHLTNLQTEIDFYATKADCEAQLTDCSVSHILGRGPIWRSDQRTIARLSDELAAARPAAAAKISFDRAQVRTLTSQLVAAEHEAAKTDAAANGWAARSRALGEIEATSPSIQHSAWLLLALLTILDLAPVLVNALIVFGGEDAYSDALEAVTARRRARLRIAKLKANEEAAVAESWSQAREDVAAAEAAAWADERTVGLGDYGRAASDVAASRPSRVETLDSSRLSFGARDHAVTKLPMPASVRRLAWIATCVAAATAAITEISVHLGLGLRGSFIAAVTAVLLLGVGTATRGFRSASLRTQQWTFAAALTGVALPLGVLAVNL